MTTNRSVRRLFWDIETSPNVVLSWRVGYKLNIDQANIVKERAIICIGYKWEGDAKAQVLQWDANQCDKAMLVKFLAIANEADELVAHNGDKFDMPWFRARCAYHGLQSMPSYKTVDTLQWARRNFYFNSNKMDYIARFLGIGGKIKTEFGLWKSICLEHSAKSMKAMTDYCKHDVALLEKVWGRLAALVPAKTHAGVLLGRDKWTCPYSGSTQVKVSKSKVTANGTVQYQMQCTSSGRYYTINARAHGQYLEAKKKAA